MALFQASIRVVDLVFGTVEEPGLEHAVPIRLAEGAFSKCDFFRPRKHPYGTIKLANVHSNIPHFDAG